MTFDENFWLLKVQILNLMVSKIGLHILGSQIYKKIGISSLNNDTYLNNFLNDVVTKGVLNQVDDILLNLL